MRKRCVYAIQLVLSLVIITALAVGCAGSPSTSAPGSVIAPPASKYPADISAKVTISEFLHIKNLSDRRAGVGKVFWVVDISIKNMSYEHAITSGYKDWHIEAGGEVYWLEEGLTQLLHLRDKTTLDDVNILVGRIGQTTFLFSVPDTLKASDAKLVYQGQEPYSYGELIGGDKVAVYDWDLKKAVPEELAKAAKTVRIVQYPEFAGAQGVAGIWEFTLNSYNIRSTPVDINITITSRHDAISEYSLSKVGIFEIIDQYGGGFIDVTNEAFYTGQYYPLDSKTGNLKFTANPKSGKIELWLTPFQLGTVSKYNRYKLFDLGEIK